MFYSKTLWSMLISRQPVLLVQLCDGPINLSCSPVSVEKLTRFMRLCYFTYQ